MINAGTELDELSPAFAVPELTLVDGNGLNSFIRRAAEAAPRQLLVLATEAITELLGQRGSCILIDGRPRVAFAPHAPNLIDWPVDLARYPEVVAAVERRELVTIEDVRTSALLESVRNDLPRELGSVAAVPLVTGDRCLGVFLIQSPTKRLPSPDAKATASLIAGITALIVARSPPGSLTADQAIPVRLAATPSAPIRREESAAPCRILLIDDDDAFAAVLKTSLVEEGYDVDHTVDGADGLRRAGDGRPDLVLLDVNLPSLNGFDIARLLRETPVNGNVPILFLSGADDLSVRVRGIRLTDVDFLPKPFSIDELLTRIQRSLDQAASRRKLLLDAEHDELTGLGNLRLLRTRMASERARFERYGSPLSLVVVDVDKLKQINDQHGHIAGSRALRAIADALRKEVRETDLPIRYGGDEFVVLLSHTGLVDGLTFANRAAAHIAALNPGGVPVTVSMGISSLGPRPGDGGGTNSVEDLLRRADAAAYRAKRLGGNRVCADGEDDPRPE